MRGGFISLVLSGRAELGGMYLSIDCMLSFFMSGWKEGKGFLCVFEISGALFNKKKKVLLYLMSALTCSHTFF